MDIPTSRLNVATVIISNSTVAAIHGIKHFAYNNYAEQL